MTITRIDHNRTHGFQVRIWRDRKEYSCMFSDKKCGGRNAALFKAKEFEKNLIEVFGKYNKHQDKKRPQKNNTSGILGVSRIKQLAGNKKFTGKYQWIATWVDPKTHKKKTVHFSENKYGAERAKEMAAACRLAKKNIFREK